MGPLGSNDALVHPRGSGAFPRILARYVRDLEIVSLERVIAQMTSVAANDLKLYDRGRIAPGSAADPVVFDATRVRDRSTFAEPNLPSEGIIHVLVNGRFVIEQGKTTAALPGRVLRRQGMAPVAKLERRRRGRTGEVKVKTAASNDRSQTSRCAAAIGLLMILSLAAMIRADLLYFTKGGEAQLPARVEGNRVVLSMPDGEIELAREDCHKIVPGFWPAAEWSARREKAGAGGFRCAVRGHVVGARERVDHRSGRGSAGAPPPGPEARAHHANGFRSQPARGAMPGPRFRRVSQGARNRGKRGARAACPPLPSASAGRGRRAHGDAGKRDHWHSICSLPPRESSWRPRAGAWFQPGSRKRRISWRFFTRKQPMRFATTRGYFHPTWDTVVAFDARSTEEQRTARGMLAARRDELGRFSQRLETAPHEREFGSS